MRTRPLGITIIAMLLFANVAAYGALLTLSLVNTHALATVLRSLSPGGSGPEIQLRMGGWLPVYYALGVGATVALGLGFWRLWNWARLVALAAIALSSVALVVGTPKLFASRTAAGVGLWLARVGLCAFFGWYLSSARVRMAFQRLESKDFAEVADS